MCWLELLARITINRTLYVQIHSKRGNRFEVQVWLGESVDLTRGLYVVLLNRYRMRALLRAIAILNVSMFIIINTRLALFVNKSAAFERKRV